MDILMDVYNLFVEIWPCLFFVSLFFILNFLDAYKYKHDRYYTDLRYNDLDTGHVLRSNDVVAEVLDVRTRVEKSNIFPIIYEELILLVKGEKFVVNNEEFRECNLLYTNKYVKGDSVVVSLTDVKSLHNNMEKTIVRFENKVARYIRKPFWRKSWVK